MKIPSHEQIEDAQLEARLDSLEQEPVEPNEDFETRDASSWHRTYQRGLKQHIAFTNATIIDKTNPMNTEQRDFVDDPLQATQAQRDKFDKEVEAYWKSKQGFCLACNLPIALEDSYCPKCTEFLVEVHTQTPNPHT